MNYDEVFQKKIKSLRIGNIQHHIFLCSGKETNGCCSTSCGESSWSYLKKRVSELFPDGSVYRTKVGCLRICAKGPIAVVYPDGIWYHSCTEENIEKILQQHILQGTPVQELTIASAEIDQASPTKL